MKKYFLKMMIDCMVGIEHLESLYSVNSAVASSPHEAVPLDPVVGGHGGVPDSAGAVVHGTRGVDQELKEGLVRRYEVLADSPGPQSGSAAPSPVLSVNKH